MILYYRTDLAGAWLSDRPFDANEGAEGEKLLTVDIPEEVITDFEWVEEIRGYREWLIPAELVNGLPVRRVDEAED